MSEKKYVVLATNEKDDYIFYLPIVTWGWQKLGWQVLATVYGKVCNIIDPMSWLYGIKGYRSETIVQCSRLYAADYVSENVMLLTSDVDMLPLSDYWKPDINSITCYGRDLSNEHYPICYIAASTNNWKRIMNLTGNPLKDMQRDLDSMPKAKSDNWQEWWQVDQDLVTERLSSYENEIVRIDRGIAPNTHYPLGRIDRGAWKESQNQPLRIDAHLPRKGYEKENWENVLSIIIENLNPTEDELGWLFNYRNTYVKLMEHEK